MRKANGPNTVRGGCGEADSLIRSNAIPGLRGVWCGRLAGRMKFSPLLTAVAVCVAPMTFAKQYLAFIGTYTGPKSKGIYAYRVDPATEVIEELGLVAETPNPTFLALHPSGHFLYAANEIADFQATKAGSITAYRIDPATGHLSAIGAASTVGSGPCHLNVDSTGRQVVFANYGSGSVGSLPLRENGGFGPNGTFFQHLGASVNPQRQKEPHGHSINFSPDGRFAFACDLGTDEIRAYHFGPATGLSAAPDLLTKAVSGGGPRHLTFSPDGRFAYVNNEMLSSVTAFRYDAGAGRLKPLQTLSTLPDGFSGNSSTAEVRTSPNGQWLFVSNRGHDSLARFRIAAANGTLTPAGHVPTGGKTPRNFCPTPDGKFLWAANQDTDNITVFRMNQDSGELTRTGQELKVGRPVCIRFLELK